MKSEKLQCLLYSFLKNRQEFDKFDDPQPPPRIQVVNWPKWKPQSSSEAVGGELFKAECGIIAELAPPRFQAVSRPVLEAQSAVYPVAEGEFVTPASLIHLFPLASTMPTAEELDLGRRLSRLAKEFSDSNPEKSIVKFEDVCIVKEPKMQKISIPINRLHCTDQETKVSWETCNKTALAGTHYVGSSGELIFDKGDTRKTIEIQILDSSEDLNDLRFTVKLHHIGGMFDPLPLTIALEKINVFDENEKQLLNRLRDSQPSCVMDIRSILGDCLNNRTFHMALTHLCSYGSTTDCQLALAFELSSLCVRELPGLFSKTLSGQSVFNILTDFFRMD